MSDLAPSGGGLEGCELCRQVGGDLVHEAALWRVVRVPDAAFPAFYRLIWRAHVAEFSALPRTQRIECIDAVAAIEKVLRERLQPTKVNLASLGNVVPHLHWHVIARFDWDSHFPNPIWGAPVRVASGEALTRLLPLLSGLDAAVADSLK